ncbi:MAG: hypothetical protein Q7J54_06795 [Candidatus Woesearchaeota archaeon]|nr:hypothetical protein [Candidatus Woesearchaeota archaeon]
MNSDEALNAGSINKSRIKHFLRHLYKAGAKIKERERSREDLKRHISKLKTVKEKPIFLTELKKLENKIFDVVEKEKSVLYNQQKDSAVVNQLKDRIAFLENELKLHHDINEKKQREKISAEEEFAMQETAELRSLLRALERNYHKIKGREKNKKKLDLIKARIEQVKKKIKALQSS